ncbi:MAG: hypothetical protein R6W99_04655 [Clostridia bacterium]
MINKIGKFLRKIHRYLTPAFVAITVWYLLLDKNSGVEPVLYRVQRLLMLTLAFTGAFLFFQIYYNKGKSKKRRIAEKQ